MIDQNRLQRVGITFAWQKLYPAILFLSSTDEFIIAS